MAELAEAEGGLASEGVPRAESGPRAAGSLNAEWAPISARVPRAAGSLKASVAGDVPKWRVAA